MPTSNGVNNTIENLLSDWGQSKRQLPDNHQAMKNELLAKLGLSPAKITGAPLRLPWMSFAFTALAVFAFVVLYGQKSGINNFSPQQSTLSSGNAGSASPLNGNNSAARKDAVTAPLLSAPPRAMNSLPSTQSLSDTKSYPYYTVPGAPEVPSTDNREFIKTDYSASIQTGRVAELAQRIQTIVRGFDGRVDSSGNSDEQGYVSFVIPAGRLDAFKTEVKSIAGAKFYTESLSSQNMLSDKRSLEDQQNQTNNTLSQLTADRDQLNVDHNKTIASLNMQLSAIAREAAGLKIQALNTINYDRQLQIQTRLADLQKQAKDLNVRLANENSSYTNQLNSLNYQIQDAQGTLDQLGKQAGDLLDTVATVRGTISISYISLWGILGLYLPAYWEVYVLIIAAFIAYYVHRCQSSLLSI